MRISHLLVNFSVAATGAVLFSAVASAEPTADPAALKIARGRYLVKLAGCNDCHTPGYAPANGKIPESNWLVGDPVGWHGPWGTTYSINLRSHVQALTEDAWVQEQRTAQARPPMPWYLLQEMEEADLRAIYAFIKSLGSATSTVPEYLPPGKLPTPPYNDFVMPPEKKEQK